MKLITSIREKGINIETYRRRQRADIVKKLFNPNIKLYNGSKNAIIYEVQKELNNRGHKIQIDGVYRIETFNAIKSFEENNNLLDDGLLDDLTIEMMFQ